ncbi:MAG: hypothetical protein ACKO2Z_28965, partial [Sphaerospermopsis kisseleviana]
PRFLEEVGDLYTFYLTIIAKLFLVFWEKTSTLNSCLFMIKKGKDKRINFLNHNLFHIYKGKHSAFSHQLSAKLTKTQISACEFIYSKPGNLVKL